MAEKYMQIHLSTGDINELRGKQSVRTTFRLPERSIMALSVLSAQLGIKQKSLFDHISEDLDILHACARAAEAAEIAGEKEQGIAKTYVISRKTLENLERVAASCNASRDALVISSIERIMPLLAEEQQKHKRRKKIVAEAGHWLDEGLALFHHSRKTLGDDDPAVVEFASMLHGVQKSFANLESMVEKGKMIEEF